MIYMSKRYFINILSILGLLLINVSSYAEYAVIRFASEIYPPFTLQHDDKELHGFDIDVAKALCTIIDTKCTFSNSKFSDMKESLKTHKYDAWINAITITDERQKEISFTEPYFSSKAMLIATNDTVFNAAPIEIKGKTIGVGEHTCYIQYLNDTYKDIIKVKIFPSRDEAFVALETGNIDAFIDDDIALKHWRLSQKNPRKYRLIGLPAKFKELRDHKYGIAVAKDNPELMNDLNHALEHLKTDGTLDKIIDKHFFH